MRGRNLLSIHLSENASSEKKPALQSGGKDRAHTKSVALAERTLKVANDLIRP